MLTEEQIRKQLSNLEADLMQWEEVSHESIRSQHFNSGAPANVGYIKIKINALRFALGQEELAPIYHDNGTPYPLDVISRH